MYDKFMKNAILLAKNQEHFPRKCKKSYFSTKYRISAQNRIRPWCSSSMKKSGAIVSRFIEKEDDGGKFFLYSLYGSFQAHFLLSTGAQGMCPFRPEKCVEMNISY